MDSQILSRPDAALGSKGFQAIKSATINRHYKTKATRIFYLSLLILSFSTLKANVVYTWTGATSNDWSDSTNWSPVSASGGPYGCNADVIIPVTVNSPIMTSSAIVGNVQLNDNAQLTLKTTLTICKNWTGGTTSYATVAGPGLVEFESDSTQVISGITQMSELLVDNAYGVTMQSGAVLDLYISLDLKGGNFDATAGSLTLKSNSADSAAFVDNFTYGEYANTVIGNVTVERYYANSLTYNQHFLGSPVNNPPLTQFGASGTPGFVENTACDETRSSATSPYGTLFALHESNGAACALQEWEVITSGNAQNVLGYSFLNAGAGKLILNGTLNLDTVYSIGGLTNSGWTNTSLQGRTYTSGWQLISNPYMAELALTQTPDGFDNQVQIWNAEGPYAGSYQPGIIGNNAFIAPFQAFMVHKTNVGGTATYTINGNERVRNISTFYFQNANQLNIVATNTANGMLDRTTISFNVAATDSFDPQYDAVKLPGALNRHTIYTDNGSMWMAVNVLHDITAINTLPMGFEPGATGTYSLAFNGMSTFDPTVYIYLEDKVTHTTYNIRNGNYTFTADSADTWNRFILHFNPPVQINTTDAGCTGPGSIKVTQAGIAYWNYTLTDSSNTVISSGVINENQPANIQADAGYYLLTLVDTNNYTVTKAITVNGPSAAVAGFTVSGSSDVLQTNQSITLTASATDAANYQWDFGNGTTGAGAMTTVSYDYAGSYNISLTTESETGCTATSAQTVTITAPTGITVVSSSDGPAIWSNNNIIYVDFANMQLVNATVIIYDILGRQVSYEQVTSSLLYQHQINNIEAGYFIVSAINENQTTTKKVLITNYNTR